MTSRTKTKDKSALADRIVALCTSGVLPEPFGTTDVRKHFGSDYAESHIRTVLSNYCEETGYWVKRGYNAKFKRISDGKYMRVK